MAHSNQVSIKNASAVDFPSEQNIAPANESKYWLIGGKNANDVNNNIVRIAL